MSYILDALKKADQEKKLGEAPKLDTIVSELPSLMTTPKKRRGKVLWIFGGVLSSLVIAGMSWLVFSTPTADKPLEVVKKQPISQKPVKLVQKQPIQNVQAQVQVIPKKNKPVENQIITRKTETVIKPSKPRPVIETKQPEMTITPSSTPFSAIKQPSTPVSKNIPSLIDMPEQFQRQIPQLKFNAHVYSSNPEKGMIIVNGETHRVGSELAPRLILESITERGVVLKKNETIFKMEVIASWVY